MICYRKCVDVVISCLKVMIAQENDHNLLQKIIEIEGGIDKAKSLFDSKSDKKSNYKPMLVKSNSVGEKYSNILNNIFLSEYDFKDYDRSSNILWPGNKIGHGREDVMRFWNSLKNIFSNIKFSIEHIGYLEEPDKNAKASIRWFLEGKHVNESKEYGKETNSNLFIMGINHVEFGNYGINREWVLFDEVAIWKQIIMKGN